MRKYVIFLLLSMSTACVAMHANRSISAIDLAGKKLTKQVQRNSTRTKSREIYCADLDAKQQLIAMRTTSGSESHVCCDLNIDNGPCLNAVPLNDMYFELLEKKYHQMKADSR